MKPVDEKKLNKEQVEAIKYKKGPLLVIAGAGTGKTTVITERIKYLILSKLAKPEEILALTFTEKAAQEMQERVDLAMPYGYTSMWISTFHSFCDRVLRDQALHIGLDPKYKLMSQAESLQLVRNNLFKFQLKYFLPLGNPTKFVDGMLQHFSRLQDEDVAPNTYFSWMQKQNNKKTTDKLENEKWKELAGAYRTYDELKIKEGVMDFGDLIVKTLKLFRKRSNVLKQYQNQFKYLLVDEFQDTNYAQNELAILLAGKDSSANITVTGDDDQSIYRFRGAAVSNIIQFRKSYKKAKIVVLNKNYRSTQEILDKAYDLIQYNNPDRLEAVEKINKKLESVSKIKGGEEIKFIHTDRVENEAEAVAKEIKELKNSANYGWRDFAILVRANNHSEPFIRALLRHNIPCQFLGPGRLFKQPEIVDLISFLRVLYNFEDSVSFYRLLSIEYFAILPKDLAAVGNYARRYNLSYFEAAEKIDVILVSKETKEKVKKILALISKYLGLINKETAGQLLYYFLQDTDLLPKLLNPDCAEGEKRAVNISKFFDKLKTYEVDHEDATIPAVVDWINLSMELGESPQAVDMDWTKVNAVNILTVHSAKGLEFPVVFLVNLVAQRFPSLARREQIPIPEELIRELLPIGDYHLQEERRLFYVGMTRAKERLYFTGADYYGEGKREKALSPFVFEALGDQAVSSEKQTLKKKQLSFLDYKTEPLIIKQKPPIMHIDYLSYSQIETFRVCPLHYKLRYFLKVPTAPSSALSFGTSMHAALNDFYLAVKSGEKAGEKLILELLSRNWVKEGYASRVHEEKMFAKGKGFLREYLKREFSSKLLPVALEQSFVVPLVQVGNKSSKKFRALKIGGKIDRVDVLPDGKIEIIDYKTGANVPTKREVDHDLQLTFYALAASGIKEYPFNKKPKEIVLTLYYFDNQTKITTTRSQGQLEEAIGEIYSWREKIEKSDFACSGGILCNNCEFKMLCG